MSCTLCGWVHGALTREDFNLVTEVLPPAYLEAMSKCSHCGRLPPEWRVTEAGEVPTGATVPACLIPPWDVSE